MTEEHLIDFTPELRAEALAIVRQYRHGRLFDPPSRAEAGGTKGTIVSHTVTTTWTGGAADPETGIV